MDSKKMYELLSRYWDCETTLEEEETLRRYFQQSEIAEHHKEAAALFRYFSESKKKSLTDTGFDRDIAAKTTRKQGRIVSLMQNSMRIAAGVAVLMVALWFVRNEVREPAPKDAVDTYDDPKLAFEETKKALRIISQGIGQAEEHTRKINLLNEASEEIRKPEKETL